jgi:hypothetical protein
LFCDMHWSSKLSIISYMTSCEYCVTPADSGLAELTPLSHRLCHRQWLLLHHCQLRSGWPFLG